MLHLVEERELACDKCGAGQKVEPFDSACPPVDIIRAEDLKGLVELGLLLQLLDCHLQQAAGLSGGDDPFKHHPVFLVKPPEEWLCELLHYSYGFIALD